mgnify:CR=1 FL=1
MIFSSSSFVPLQFWFHTESFLRYGEAEYFWGDPPLTILSKPAYSMVLMLDSTVQSMLYMKGNSYVVEKVRFMTILNRIEMP